MKQMVKRVQEAKANLESVELPSLEEMLEEQSQKYPFEEDFKSAKRNPIVILHSSGSTSTRFLELDMMK